MRIPIPSYAKRNAKKGLELRQKQDNPSGLTEKEAKILGINSGVGRARQLRDNKTISIKDAKSILSFLNRFKNQKSKRSKIAVMLWGDDDKGKFRQYLSQILGSLKN